MHEYLKAIGFSNIKTKKELKNLLTDVQKSYDWEEMISVAPGSDFCEYRKDYGKDIGISIFGEPDDNYEFEMDCYFPYFNGKGITSYADIIVERRMDREIYVGICEEIKIGVSLIFHLQNIMEYKKQKQLGNMHKSSASITLSGLSDGGTILLPIKKTEIQEKAELEESRNRMMLLSAAKTGDQNAIETLTLEDMDIYSQVSQRLVTEDVFSIVDTYFMPYGIECDRYSIMGTILEKSEVVNEITSEEMYVFTLDVNELKFDVCVPKKYVIGEPAIGRRFKGNIWLQGKINF